MKTIQLTKGLTAAVDDEDYEWLVKMGSWCVVSPRNRPYAGRRVNGKFQYMHKLILRKYGKDDKIVDHSDGDSLNNQKSNLRSSKDNTINMLNQEAEGVWVRSDMKEGTRRYCAQLVVNGTRILDSHFYTYEEAKKAYEETKKAVLDSL